MLSHAPYFVPACACVLATPQIACVPHSLCPRLSHPTHCRASSGSGGAGLQQPWIFSTGQNQNLSPMHQGRIRARGPCLCYRLNVAHAPLLRPTPHGASSPLLEQGSSDPAARTTLPITPKPHPFCLWHLAGRFAGPHATPVTPARTSFLPCAWEPQVDLSHPFASLCKLLDLHLCARASSRSCSRAPMTPARPTCLSCTSKRAHHALLPPLLLVLSLCLKSSPSIPCLPAFAGP